MNKTIMCAFLFLFCVVTIEFPGAATAESTTTDNNFIEVDASGVWSSAPASEFHDGYGVNVGAGIMLNQSKTLQGRIDISSLQWKRTDINVVLYYKKLPIAVSGRYYIPTYAKPIKLFVQFGVEVSSDRRESTTSFPVTNESTNKTNVGITPGVGIEFGIGPSLDFFVAGRDHIISGHYFDLLSGLAVHF